MRVCKQATPPFILAPRLADNITSVARMRKERSVGDAIRCRVIPVLLTYHGYVSSRRKVA